MTFYCTEIQKLFRYIIDRNGASIKTVKNRCITVTYSYRTVTYSNKTVMYQGDLFYRTVLYFNRTANPESTFLKLGSHA